MTDASTVLLPARLMICKNPEMYVRSWKEMALSTLLMLLFPSMLRYPVRLVRQLAAISVSAVVAISRMLPELQYITLAAVDTSPHGEPRM